MSQVRLRNLAVINSTRVRAILGVWAAALLCVLPLYLLARASVVWNENNVPSGDDVWLARMCLPEGLAVFIHEYGFYRFLGASILALVNRYVINGTVPLPLSLAVLTVGAAIFARTCVVTGLPLRRGLILFGLLTGSPFLVETAGFWTGAAVHSLVLLYLATQLRAVAWAQSLKSRTPGILVIAGGALLGLGFHEMVLPLVVATSALLGRTRLGRILAVVISVSLLFSVVVLLGNTGLYHAVRWTDYGRIFSDPQVLLSDNFSAWRQRVSVYETLLPSLLRTGFSSLEVWLLLTGLGVFTFLSPSKSSESDERSQLERASVAACFAFSFLVAITYFLAMRSFTMRYLAFMSVYGFAALAWMEGRVASLTLALLLVVQSAVAGGLPVHLRDAEMARFGVRPAVATGPGDVIVVDGRLTRARWGYLFESKDAHIVQQQVAAERWKYLTPCEKPYPAEM